MKDLYAWHFPPGPDEIEAAWSAGILSVDTNVLLDLYRYHEETRELLLSALEYFGERTWLTHQVAEEFFRNRNTVIASSTSGFSEADKIADEILNKIQDQVSKLLRNRLLPGSRVSQLQSGIEEVVRAFKVDIASARESFPNFRDNDVIIDRICKLFEGRVGSAYEKDRLDEALKEAKKRFESEIPPGYKDNTTKKGDRRYGDYLVWRQLLDRAESIKQPLVFVTSEIKEDWWERPGAKTIGPRQELLKEYFNITGKKMLFYQTDRFLAFAADRIGRSDVSDAVNEIRDLAKVRTRSAQLVQLVSQEAELEDNETWQRGTLVVRLLRPSYKFTCSGGFEPHMLKVPDLTVALKKHPEGMPEFIVRHGTGTTYDFNIHVKSIDFGETLPAGEYTFFYDAVNDVSSGAEVEI